MYVTEEIGRISKKNNTKAEKGNRETSDVDAHRADRWSFALRVVRGRDDITRRTEDNGVRED
jgi:hypothetical protein